MKFLLKNSLFFLVISINIVTSSTEVINKCKLGKNNDARKIMCEDFQQDYLPFNKEFENATTLDIKGNFIGIVIDSSYENLQFIYISSTNLEIFEFEVFTNFTILKGVYIRNSDQVIEVDFTGVDKIPQLMLISITSNKMLTYSSCESLKSSKLIRLDLFINNLESFDFSCLPKTLMYLELNNNLISSLNMESNVDSSIYTDSYCSSMKSLTSLASFSISSNRLQDFSFKCFPNSIESVSIQDNNITEIPDISYLPHSHRVDISMWKNPIRCTCSLFRDYVQLLNSGNVTFYTFNDQTLTCANTDSKLADYPWTNDVAANKLHDASAIGCLTGGEDTGNNNDDDSENSGSFNFVDVSFIIITHAIQLYVMLM